MAKILIVDDECELLDLLSLLIEGEYGHHVLKASSPLEANRLLKETNSIELVICDWNMSDGGGGAVFRYMKENRKIPLIVITGAHEATLLGENDFKGLPHFKILEKPFEMDVLMKNIQSALAVTLNDQHVEEDYSKIGFSSLLHEKVISYPLYIKLGQSKFVKVALENENDLKDTIAHYRQKDVHSFYMKREDFRNWIEVLFETKEIKTSGGPLSHITDVCRLYHSRLHLQLSAFGIEEKHVKLVGMVLSDIVRELNARPNLAELLEIILQSDNFLGDHSFFIIFLATYLAKDLGLSSEGTTKKIIYAAFFHDLGIRDPELVKREREVGGIDARAEHQEVKYHAQTILEQLDRFPEFRGEVAQIIMEHHEEPDGSGYPHGINAGAIHPLSCLFILCHRASELFLLKGLTPAQVAAQFKGELGEFYNEGNFRRPLQVMRSHFAL